MAWYNISHSSSKSITASDCCTNVNALVGILLTDVKLIPFSKALWFNLDWNIPFIYVPKAFLRPIVSSKPLSAEIYKYKR